MRRGAEKNIEVEIKQLVNVVASQQADIANMRKRVVTATEHLRDAVNQMLEERTSLGERLKILFREKGVTIASILTAVGIAVSSLVLTIRKTFGGDTTGPAGTHGPPGTGGGVTDWLKKQLNDIAAVLKSLGELSDP